MQLPDRHELRWNTLMVDLRGCCVFVVRRPARPNQGSQISTLLALMYVGMLASGLRTVLAYHIPLQESRGA